MVEHTNIITTLMKISGAERVSKGIRQVEEAAKSHKVTSERLGTGMRRAGLEMTKQGRITSELTGKEVSADRAMGMIKRSTGRFRMELLSLMFAGMAINRLFGGMIKDTLTLTGATDLLSMTFAALLLPMVLDKILPAILKLTNFVMGLSTEQKGLIGNTILLAAVFGTLLTVVAMVGLAISALPIGLGMLALKVAIVGAAIVFWIFYWRDVLNWLWERWISFVNWFKTLPSLIAGIVRAITSAMLGLLTVTSPLGLLFSQIFRGAAGLFGIHGFQYGGVVPATGLYRLHAGETVSPSGGFMFSPTVYISATVSSDVDIRRLGEGLSHIWAENLKSKLLR